jgi:hypothetical protein
MPYADTLRTGLAGVGAQIDHQGDHHDNGADASLSTS